MKEGHIDTNGYRTYFKHLGIDKNAPPIMIVHGGPGASHEYLLSLSALGSERPVVFYDQFGAGQSDGHNKPDQWTVETMVSQLEAVRKKLKLKEMHLYGHSWGGMLALAYLQSQPMGVRSLSLGSTMYDIPLYMSEVDKLLKAVSPETLETARKCEKAGTTDSREYREIINQWNERHIWYEERPEALETDGYNWEQYHKMWGPSEFAATGELKDWSAAPWMNVISQPTFVLAGEYDEVTEKVVKNTTEFLPHAEYEIIQGGAHLVHMENPAPYLRALRNFLELHDS